MPGPDEPIDLTTEPEFRLGSVVVRPRSLQLVRDEKRVSVQALLMKVLVLLARNDGETVSRDEFRVHCWEGLQLSEHALNRTVSQLRAALRDVQSSAEILTVRGIGYRLIADPESAEQGASDTSAAASQHPPTGNPITAAITWLRTRTGRSIAAGAVAVGGLLFASLIFPAISGSTEARVDYNSIAVLPFEDVSGSADLDYLAHGAEVEIREGLTLADGSLRVSARASSSSAELTDRSPAEVGRILDVDVLLEGVIRDVERTPRLSLTLVDAASGVSMWSRSFHVSAENLEVVRAIVVDEVLGLLDREQGGERARADLETVDPRAYVEILRAERELERGDTESLMRARDYFESALTFAPDNVEAMLGIVQASLADERHADHNQARMHLERAIELAPWGRETLLAEQLFNDHLVADGFGEEWLSRPGEPRRTAALDFGARLRSHIVRSELLEAEALVEEILEVDPIGVRTNANVARVLNRRGKPKLALQTLARALEYSPGSIELMFWRVNTLSEMGDFDGGVDQLVTMLELAPRDLPTRYFLSLLLGQLGFIDEGFKLAPGGVNRLRVLGMGDDEATLKRLAEIEKGEASEFRDQALIRILIRDLDDAKPWMEAMHERDAASHYFEHPHDYLPYLSLAYRNAGEEERARQLDAEILEEIRTQIAQGDESVVLFLPYQTLAAAARSDLERLYPMLERSAAGGYILFGLDDPIFDHLRDEPEFATHYARFKAIREEQRASIVASGAIDRVRTVLAAATPNRP